MPNNIKKHICLQVEKKKKNKSNELASVCAFSTYDYRGLNSLLKLGGGQTVMPLAPSILAK